MLRLTLLVFVGSVGFSSSMGKQLVPLPLLTLEIQSRTEAQAGSFLSSLLVETNDFLESYFVDYLSRTGATYNTLGGVSLNIRSYDTKGDFRIDEQEMATVNFGGNAVFDSSPAPSVGIVGNLVRGAFQGASRQEFLSRLLASQNSFLEAMTYLVVSIDGVIISSDELTADLEGSNGHDGSSSAMLIIILCSAGGLLLVAAGVGMFVFLRHKDASSNIRTVEIPKKTRTSRRQHDELEIKATRSPSPEPSIASQDSSKFTFNPIFGIASVGGGGSTIDSKTLPSHFSAVQVDVSQAIDVEAWKNSKNTISPITPAPFGHDISAIDLQKDLSHIEEASNEDMTPGSRSGSYLSKEYLTRMDNSVPSRCFTSRTSNVSSEPSFVGEEDSDVIKDLENLSVLFKSHRGSRF
jgi:hypothetical protein